jgi:glycerol-3-phosphate dehydrogenase
MAVHLNDVLARRTRLALTDRNAGLGSDAAADLMTDELGWSTHERLRQIAAHRSDVERERSPDPSRASVDRIPRDHLRR